MWPLRPFQNNTRIFFLQMWISESFMVSHPSQTKLTVECQKDRDGELVKWSRVKGVDLSPKFKVAVKSFPSLQLFSRLSKKFWTTNNCPTKEREGQGKGELFIVSPVYD